MLCEVRMAKPRLANLPSAVLNSFAAAVALRHAGKLAVHQIKKRLGALGQIGRLGEPVIHLDVDVRVIIGMPRRLVVVVPKPLQIRGQTAGARTGNQQVAAILEQQFLKLRVNRLGGLELCAGRWATRFVRRKIFPNRARRGRKGNENPFRARP